MASAEVSIAGMPSVFRRSWPHSNARAAYARAIWPVNRIARGSSAGALADTFARPLEADRVSAPGAPHPRAPSRPSIASRGERVAVVPGCIAEQPRVEATPVIRDLLFLREAHREKCRPAEHGLTLKLEQAANRNMCELDVGHNRRDDLVLRVEDGVVPRRDQRAGVLANDRWTNTL